MENFEFQMTQPIERGLMEIGGKPYEYVSCGSATLSGLDIPITNNIGIMGILFSINRDIMEEFYKVSICMTCGNRRLSTDPYKFDFHVDYRPIESSGENPKAYEERCIDCFKIMLDLFQAQISIFVNDPEGLSAYREYIATTEDDSATQLRHVKEMRDALMIKAGFRTKSQIAAKRKARKAHEQLVKRPKNLPRGLRAIVNEQTPKKTDF